MKFWQFKKKLLKQRSKTKKILLSGIAFSLFLGALSGCNSSEKENQFNVSFDGKGGTLVSGQINQTVSKADEIVAPVFEMRGYSFDDWNIPLNTITESTSVEAQWKISSYSITYHLNGGTNSVFNPTHFNITSENIVLEDASKPGYSFDYWSTSNGTKITTIYPADAKDYDVFANYKTVGYSISYELNGGSFVSTEPTTYNIEQDTSVPNAQKNGYTFIGWSYKQDGSDAEKNFVINKGNYGDVKLYAIFSPNTYVVTYDVNGGSELASDTDEFVFNSGYQLKTPYRIGYSFVCWKLNGEPINMSGEWTVSSNVTLVAEWELSTYSISYVLNGGTNSSINKTQYTYEDEDYVVNNPTREGYSFIGWDDGSGTPIEGYVISKHSTGNLNLEAYWQANTYIVSLDVNGGNDLSETELHLVYDDEFELPTPTRPGYVFAGWYYNESRITSNVWSIPDNVTLSAHWDREQYQITYVLNGGTNHELNPDGYNYDDDTITILPASRNGYSFVGWSTDDDDTPYNNVQIDHNSVGAKTFYAHWQANDYQITYDLAGGTGIDELTETVTFDTEHTSPIPSRTGYSFIGWYFGDTKVNDGIWKIYEDCTLVARWLANEYTITKENGDGAGTQTVRFGDGYNLGTSHKDGYDFNGWYSEENGNGTKYTDENGNSLIDYSDDKDITLFAFFTYTVHFETNGGSSVEDRIYKENECLEEGINPTKKDRTFGGWYTDEELISPVSYSDSLGNITLFAKWNEEVLPTELTYSKSLNSIEISGTSHTDPTFVLPSHIGGTPIKAISNNAFANSSFSLIYVPDTVETIGRGAFFNCNLLVNITLPFVGKSIDAVGPEAVFGYIFNWTTSGKNPYSYDDTTNYGGDYLNTKYGTQPDGTIWQWSGLSNPKYSDNYYSRYYYIPTSIRNVTITRQTSIPTAAFNNCSFLETITIPNSTTSIGAYAFANCSGLKRLNSNVDGVFNIPNGVTQINEYTFDGCSLVTKFTLSNNVESIGKCAFRNCSLVTQFNSTVDGQLIIPSSCVSIGDYAFEGFGLMTDLYVPDTVETIGRGAFFNCNLLVNITLPFVGKSIDAVGPEAVFGYIFNWTTSGKNPYSYDDTTNYGGDYLNTKYGTQPDGTIWQWSGLSNPKYSDNYYSRYYYIPTSIRNVTITRQTSIPTAAFNNCSFLETITIPNSTTSIGAYAFANCTATVNQTYEAKVSSLWDGSVAVSFHGGDGTEENPYVIFDGSEYAYFVQEINNGNTFDRQYIILTSDINLNGLTISTAGDDANPFLGHFNGNGHIIKNGVVSSTDNQYCGVFG